MAKSQHITIDIGLFILRLLTGAGMAYHGYGKIFGGSMPRFIEGVTGMGFPVPELFAWMAALSEFAGGTFLLIGLFTRPAALMILTTMLVAAFMAHAADPFAKKELALGYASIAAALIFTGGGKISLDNLLNLKIK